MIAKTKMLGLVLATAVVFNAPMFVYADNGGGDKDWHQGGDMHHGQGHMMAKILNLSEDQVKQLKDIHQKQREAMKSVFEQMKSNREAFDAEIVKATPDMNKISSIQAEIKTLQSQMVDNHLNSMLEIKKVMTPEQFAGYMALTRAKKMMMQHHGPHQFGRKGGDDHKNWGDQDKGHPSDD